MAAEFEWAMKLELRSNLVKSDWAVKMGNVAPWW